MELDVFTIYITLLSQDGWEENDYLKIYTGKTPSTDKDHVVQVKAPELNGPWAEIVSQRI